MKQHLLFVLFLFFATNVCSVHPGFVDVADLDSTIIVEMRYSGEHNFMGKIVDGYHIDKVCLLTEQAARNLVLVNRELRKDNQVLKVYDCYRPQRAVDNFVRWSRNEDTTMQEEFYPTKNKTQLILEGYIATQSGHSRGSTVDLTIVDLPPKEQPEFKLGVTPLKPCFSDDRFPDNSIDMGTGFDCFHEKSHTNNSLITPKQYENRMKLVNLMKKYNFTNYDKEWWHFTLKNEPFPNTYFDFIIEKPLTSEDMAIMIAVITSASLSFIASFIFFVYVIVRTIQCRKYFNFNMRLLTTLQICTVLSHLSDFYIVFGKQPDYGFLCILQAVQMQFMNWAVFLWISVISFWLYYAIYYPTQWRKLPRGTRIIYEIISHLIVWSGSTFFTVLPLIPNNTYGRAGDWCWINKEKPYGGFWTMASYYAPLWVLILVVFIVYIICLIRVVQAFNRAHTFTLKDLAKELMTDGESTKFQLAKSEFAAYSKLILYPAVFLLIWVEPTFNRVFQLVTGQRVFVLSFIHILITPLHGFFNVVVYFFNPLEYPIIFRKIICCEYCRKKKRKKIPSQDELDYSIM